MVLKKSKYGYNSGRTLRRCDKDYHSKKDRFATISIKKNDNEIEFKNGFEQDTASLLEQLEPSVEYSLNKRQRWFIVEKSKEEKYFHDVSTTCLEQILPDKRSLSFHISGTRVVETPQNQFHEFAKVDKSRLNKRNTCHYKKHKKSSVGSPFSSELISSDDNKSFDGVSFENDHYPSKCLLCKQLLCLFCDSVNECKGSPPQPNVNVVRIEIKREAHVFNLAMKPFLVPNTEQKNIKLYKHQRSNKFRTDINRGWTVREAYYQLDLDNYYQPTASMKQIKSDNRRDSEKIISEKFDRPSTGTVEKWLQNGKVEQLEKVLLNGFEDLLYGKHSLNVDSQAFLNSLSEYSKNMINFLNAVVSGDIENIKKYANYRNVHKAKHPLTGGSSLHLAILWELPIVSYYLINEFSNLITTVDNNFRTPLHYAVNNFDLYEFLLHMGANEDAIDCDGYSPKQFRQNRELIDLDRMQKLSRYPIQKPDEVDEFIAAKDIDQLEQLVLDGIGNYVLNKIFPPGTEELERYLETYVRKIEAIHQAVKDGDSRTVKLLCDRKKLAAARDNLGCTPLHTAVKHNRLDIAEYLLLRFPMIINDVDVDGKTPLHYASVHKKQLREPIWQLLLKSGADNELKDKNGFTAEDLATTNDLITSSINNNTSDVVMENSSKTNSATESAPSTPEPNEAELQKWFTEGRFDELEQLVLQGKAGLLDRYSGHYQQMAAFLDNVQKNQAKLDQIHEAIKDGNLRKVKNLIDRKKLVMARNKDGKTALHLVVIHDQAPIAEYLIKTFPDCINIRDKEKRTPLHYAAVLPDRTIFETLMSNGADSSAVDKKGRTAEYYRSNPDQLVGLGKSFDMTGFNEDYDFENGNMREAPAEEQVQQWMDDGNVEELEKLVLDGRGRMIADKSSTCPPTDDFLAALPQYQLKIDAIHKAVEEGDVRRVKALIDRPELALARDKNGATPVHNAVLHGQTDTLRYLLSRFPEVVNASDHYGRTPLHYAAADRSSSVFVKLLQKSGGDAFVEDKYGHTPFFYRSNPERLKVIKLKSDAVMDQLMTGELIHSLLQGGGFVSELEEEIVDWLHTGNLGKLEELVLNGYGDLLLGKLAEVDDKDVLNFLEILPQYQVIEKLSACKFATVQNVMKIKGKIQAIHRAIENGNLREVKALLDRKKLALARDRKGATPLHKAVLHNRADITTWLLKNYPQAVNALDHNKRSPLHFAAALSTSDGGQMYKLLCKANANPNLEDCDGRSSKYYLRNPDDLNLESLRHENRGITRTSLQQRVAPSYLESSIQQWLREGNVQKLDQLVLSGCGDLLQDRTSSNGDAQKFLDELPPYLDRVGLLHKSVREGDLKTLKQILETKKMALARDRKGATPLHDAILYQQTDVARYLVSNFPHIINAPDYNKRTALHYAAAARDGGHYYKILEKAGADNSLTDKEGKTPIFYKRTPGKLDLKMILERDRDFVPDLPLMLDNEPDDEDRSDSKMSDLSFVTPPDAVRNSIDFGQSWKANKENYPDEPTSNVGGGNGGGIWMRRSPPTSENGKFLAQTVGVPLTKAIAEAVIRRPADPIGFISDYLFDYHKAMQQMTRMESDSEVWNKEQQQSKPTTDSGFD